MNNIENEEQTESTIWNILRQSSKRFLHTALVFMYGFLWGFLICFSMLYAQGNDVTDRILDKVINTQGYHQATEATQNNQGDIVLKAKENSSHSTSPFVTRKSQ